MASEAPRIEVEVLPIADERVFLTGVPGAPHDLPRVPMAAGEAFGDAVGRALRAAAIRGGAEARLLAVRSEMEGAVHLVTLLALVRVPSDQESTVASPFARDALPALGARAARAVAALSTGFFVVDLDDATVPLVLAKEATVQQPTPAVDPARRPVAGPAGRPSFGEHLAAGALLAGSFLWILGVFSILDRERLWSADGKSFLVAVVLTLATAVACSVTFGFREPAAHGRQRLTRAAATFAISLPLLLVVVFVLEEMLRIRNNAQREAFVYLGVFAVVGLRLLAGRPRVAEALPRFALRCVWLTAAFVTLWTVSPRLRRAIAPRQPVGVEE